MTNVFSSFTGLYSLSQTLTFALKPIGHTRDSLQSLLSHDQQRAQAYPQAKFLLDNSHRKLLEDTLSNVDNRLCLLSDKDRDKFEKEKVIVNQSINWFYLNDCYDNASSTDTTVLDEINHKFCLLLATLFTLDENYELLVKNATPDKYIKKVLKDYHVSQDDSQNILTSFSKFSTYFKGYQENRKNIYSSEKQQTAAPYRAICDNFPKFRRCLRLFEHIKACYPEIVASVSTELKDVLAGKMLEQLFSLPSYSQFLSQKGIDFFNLILGGCSPENGKKLRGINEFINLYRQQHEEARQDRNLAAMPLLFKQILSYKESSSFTLEPFKNDTDMMTSLKDYILTRIDNYSIDSMHTCSLIDSIHQCLKKLVPDEGIFVNSDALSDISIRICRSWDSLTNALDAWSEENIHKMSDRKKWLSKSMFSLFELSRLTLTRQYTENEEGSDSVDVLSYWKGEKAEAAFEKYQAVQIAMHDLLEVNQDNLSVNRSQAVLVIKDYLDSIMGIMHLCKALYVPNSINCNETFYSEFNSLYEAIRDIIPLYNKIRNYLTQKIGDVQKIKLMFDNPTLADGWDQNKEKDNTAILLLKDNLYYLGIMNPKAKTDFSKLAVTATSSAQPYYQKVIYKYLPGPNKMLPKVFFSQKGIPVYKPSEKLIANYNDKQHIKSSPSFNLSFCHELIDFFKKSIAAHPDWKNFNFNFSPTASYHSIDEFYREISANGYNISFSNIPETSINELVDSGKLYLFQIYSKDFSDCSTGTPNKFTMYWKALFSPENLSNIVFKLNGEAELFWRKPAIDKPSIHKIHEKMVNRTYQDGVDAQGLPVLKHMSDKVHLILFDYVNGRRRDFNDNSEAEELYTSGKITIKEVTHDIIKDRRYTQESFSFHVPISINYQASDQPAKFNETVIAHLKNNPSVNIIGIDRGERNLLYYSLIDQQGHILQQGSLNSIVTRAQDSVNYHQLLDTREKERADARKNWECIGQIKDLKAGYMSQVIHKLAKLMIENNAIVVLENLNVGFKRGRFAIEKQVYQNFEKALITKLNYLIFKELDTSEPGGLLNGYQLTNKFISFDRIGRQCGFLFYVPAGFTSKIDPMTGFANLFITTKCTNAESRKAFLCTFDDIHYDGNREAFSFSFNYDHFKTSVKDYKKKWTVFSATKRFVFIPKEKRAPSQKGNCQQVVNPTAMILSVLSRRGISVHDGFNLKDYLQNQEPTKTNADLFTTVFRAFELTLQMRNSCTETGEDFIQSPVLNSTGSFFLSSSTVPTFPCDADANGAYHIAMKGLLLLHKRFNQGNPDLSIKNEEWFEFMQSRNW